MSLSSRVWLTVLYFALGFSIHGLPEFMLFAVGSLMVMVGAGAPHHHAPAERERERTQKALRRRVTSSPYINRNLYRD